MKCGSWCTNPQAHKGVRRGRKKGSWSRWKEHENQNRVETTAGITRGSTLSAGAIRTGGNSKQNCKQQPNTTDSWKWQAACMKAADSGSRAVGTPLDAAAALHWWFLLRVYTLQMCLTREPWPGSQQWADLWRYHMTVMVQKQRLEGGGRDPLYLPYPYTDVISFKTYDPWSLNADEQKTK